MTRTADHGREREALGRLPFEPGVLIDLGLPAPTAGEWPAYQERVMFQPSINICGLASGYAGQGMKTIVPHQAVVKLDMRLVVDQDPDDIFAKFVAHSKAQEYGDLAIERLGGFHPSRTLLDHPVCQAAARAARQGFGKEPLFRSCMGKRSRLPVHPRPGHPSGEHSHAAHDENNHAPNENITLEGFFCGIKTSAAFLYEAAKLYGRLLKGPICGVGTLAHSLRRTWSTPRSAHRAPPCIWTLLSNLGE